MSKLILAAVAVASIVSACSLAVENGRLSAELTTAKADVSAIELLAIESQEQVARLAEARTIKGTVTSYTARVEECDEDPTITAFMTKVRIGTIAISHDLLDAGWAPGMRVYIKGFGVFVINDLMNARFTKRVDIFTDSLKHAKKIGHNKNITIALLG
jgi:3D (Asp-Asp-Asp) domain-containing protein